MTPQVALNLFIVIFFIAYLIYEYIRDCKNEKKLDDVKSKCMKRSGMEMTDNDIVKGLEYCVDKGYCPSCPCYDNASNCKIEYDALDLINRQQAEIERYEKEHNENFNKWQLLDDRTKQRYAELYEEAKAVVRAEAVKEFAERLKVLCRQARFSVRVTQKLTGTQRVLGNIAVVDESDIDNLVKEMVGDAK